MRTYYQPTRLHFGAGALRNLGEIARPYGTSCCLVTMENSGPLQPLYDRVKEILQTAGIRYVHFAEVAPNPSTEVIEKGIAFLKENPVDFLLAIGGGSTIDTSKTFSFTYGVKDFSWEAIFETFHSPFHNPEALSKQNLPLISIPTTSGTGSQVTQAAVLTHQGEKMTFYHSSLFSKEAILDPELLVSMPRALTAMSGFDAFTHAFESYISENATVLSQMDALDAMRTIFKHLPIVCREPENMESRMMMSVAETMAGKALANAGAEAPHPLSELVGSYVNVPHGQALAILYPSFLRIATEHKNDRFKEKFNTVLELMKNSGNGWEETSNLAEAVEAMIQMIGLRKGLDDIGVDDALFETLCHHPMLEHLPFGNREYLRKILISARTVS